MKQTNYAVTMLAVATTYMLQASLNVANPILATIASVFPDLSYNTVALVGTLPTLLAIPGGLIIDKIVDAVGYKMALILTHLALVVSGILPVFFYESFMVILVCRAIFGLAYGIGYPLCSMSVRAFFESGQHSKVMGYGSICMNIANILFALLAGYVAAGFWANAFYLHIFMAIPLLFALFTKEPERPKATAAADGAKPKVKLNRAAWVYIGMASVTIVFFYGFFTYCSGMVVEKGIGNSIQAGYILTIVSVAGIVAGTIFSKLYGILGRKIYSACAFSTMVGLILLVIGTNMPMMYIGSVFVGMGFHSALPALFMGIGEDAGEAADKATGYTSTFMNLFSFLAIYILSFLAGLIGQADSTVAPFYFAIGYFAIATVAGLFLKTPKKAEVPQTTET